MVFVISKHKIIADIALTFHLLFIVAFLGGVVYSFFNRAYAPYHLSFVLITVFINVYYGGCPLTFLEKKYRELHSPYYKFKNSFYAHYFFGKLLNIEVTKNQVRIFLFLTKVIPGLLPLLLIFNLV